MSGISLLGAQDLSITVPDLDEASKFFASFFGADIVREDGPVADSRRSTMRAYANADVRAVVRASRVLRTPFLNLELIEATYPGQRQVWPHMLDVGGWHLAGYVDDIDAAVAFLDSVDVYVLGPGKKPTTNPPEVGEGSVALHGMTSWGFHFELTSYPNGRAYMADYDGRLWNPATPDRGASVHLPTGPCVPTFRGFEHVSFAVADIDEATAFFEGVLGLERFYDMGPIADRHGSGFGAYANVDVRVEVAKVRLFRSPYLNFEVIEPAFPGQNRVWPNVLDVGGWRVTFAVDDLDESLAALATADVHVLGGKRDDRVAGRTRVSCLARFGFVFDLVAGSGDTGPGWDPAHPDG